MRKISSVIFVLFLSTLSIFSYAKDSEICEQESINYFIHSTTLESAKKMIEENKMLSMAATMGASLLPSGEYIFEKGSFPVDKTGEPKTGIFFGAIRKEEIVKLEKGYNSREDFIAQNSNFSLSTLWAWKGGIGLVFSNQIIDDLNKEKGPQGHWSKGWPSGQINCHGATVFPNIDDSLKVQKFIQEKLKQDDGSIGSNELVIRNRTDLKHLKYIIINEYYPDNKDREDIKNTKKILEELLAKKSVYQGVKVLTVEEIRKEFNQK